MIKQDNIYKRYFDAILLIVTLFAALEVPLHLSLKYHPPHWIQVINLIYPFLFTIDIIVAFFTTITVDGQEVTSKKTIAIKYLRSWFIVDLIAAIPFDLIFSEGYLSEASNAARSLRLFSPRYIQILLLVRMLRIYHIFPFLERTKKKELLNPGLVRLFFTIFVVLIIAHWVACGWLALGKIDDKLDHYSNYLKALYWCITTITTIGYGDITPTTNGQTIYTMFAVPLNPVGFPRYDARKPVERIGFFDLTCTHIVHVAKHRPELFLVPNTVFSHACIATLYVFEGY